MISNDKKQCEKRLKEFAFDFFLLYNIYRIIGEKKNGYT